MITKISVVIPCRNEMPFIEECIDAVYMSKLPDDVLLHVFVADGMSDDGTRNIVQSLQSKYQTLRLLDNTKQLTPYAFNLGIYEMEFDYLQIIGARHIVSHNYIGGCLKKLQEDHGIWCVGGKIINEYVNETGKTIALAMSTTFGMGLGNFRTLNKSGYTDTVTSPMYPARVFDEIGYFDEELVRNQDDDFNFRVAKAGGKIFYNNDISLKYYVRGNFTGLWKQFFQYGYWKVYVNKKHKAITTVRQLVPPLFVVYLLLLFITPFLSLITAGFFGIPFIAYILMAFYFSYTASREDDELGFLDILLTFPILHISYGLGYLKGIFSFFILNQQPSDKQKELSR